ncbi:hypothetical protein AMJ85_00275 [candidate division BRC1 bacterium SM23_51]|nr:MAG: hypothetical protein AMJ85_00275 [candidate division BRC1 bacterium SM23_51]
MESLESQLAPGSQFPGTAETFATPVGSDEPVRLKVGHPDKRHLQLSREEFRALSARQKELEAQASADQTPKLKRGRPKGSRNSPRVAPGAAKQNPPIGRPYPAPSPTPDPAPPIPIPTDAMLEQRMARLERGMDKIVAALAQRDAAQDSCSMCPQPPIQTGTPHYPEAYDSYEEEDEPIEQEEPNDDDDDEEVEGESQDAPPLRVVAKRVDDSGPGSGAGDPVFERGLHDLQRMIVKRNPKKLFRQYWCHLTRAAQYNEWPPERREAFNQIFDSFVAHPEFIYHMSKFLRGSRNGQCIGNEQIARVCGMMAGFLTVYKLATTGQ